LGKLSLLLSLQELQPNRILLITIHNPLYPITVDVLHQVFSPHGFVEKIVTFQKSAGQLSILFLLFISLSAPHFCPCLALLLIGQPQLGTPT
jgi:hypothetical protein